MKLIITLAALVLSACGPAGIDPTQQGFDQCLRREIFLQCMASLPKGPERVSNSNDWDEVITECERTAMRQAIRERQHIKPECWSKSSF